MVGEKEAQVTSWWVVTNDLWVNGLALLTFDPRCLDSSSTSTELSFVSEYEWLCESTESVEYSGLVNVSPGNSWVWVLPGPLYITGCRMDIQEDDTSCLLQLLCILHNNTEHIVEHIQTLVDTADHVL